MLKQTMLMYSQLTLLLFLFLGINNPNETKLDSIDIKLRRLTNNNKLEALYEYSTSLAASNPEKAKELAKELIKLSDKNQSRYKALGYYNLGEAYYYLEKYSDALNSYLQAQPYLQIINDSIRISANYSNIGLIHLYQANYSKSLSYYEKSLKIEKALRDSSGMAKSLQNMGLIFGNWERYEVQSNYYKQALDIYQQLNDYKSAADISLNLGVTFTRQNKFKEGQKYYNKALNAYSHINDSSRIASVYTNMAYYHLNMNEYNKARQHFYLAKDIFTKLNEKSGLIHAYTGLGDLYAIQGKKDEAVKMYLQCEEINKTVGLLDTKRENLYSLYETYKEMGKLENALRVLENYHEIKDSIYNEQQFEKILDLENKYLLQKSQNELTHLKAQNRLYAIFFIVSIGLAIIGGILIIYYNRHKRLVEKQRLLKLEQKVLRTQMNPHFIFNSLSAIQCYVLDNKTLDAVDFLADFANLMRMVLQYSQEEYITLEQEREILDHYINLQNKRFGDKIKYQIVIDEQLEKAKTMIPPMLAQPFIENSFEHGELCKRENGNITVKFEKRSKNISFCIEDNGIGISSKGERDTNKSKTHKSLAMKITKERLKLINTNQISNKVGLLVEDRSKYGKHGTKVEFTIPLVEMN